MALAPSELTGTPVSAQTIIPGFRSGDYIAWDAGNLSLLAIELKAAGESDDGAIPVCVLHPDSLQVNSYLPIYHTLFCRHWNFGESDVRFSQCLISDGQASTRGVSVRR